MPEELGVQSPPTLQIHVSEQMTQLSSKLYTCYRHVGEWAQDYCLDHYICLQGLDGGLSSGPGDLTLYLSS